jgi:hypothetical protein
MAKGRLSSDLVAFKIEASQCDLRVGDLVSPETVVGRDLESGELVQAGVYGQVMGVHFSSADHALVVLVRAEPYITRGRVGPDLLLFKIDASRFDLQIGSRVTPDTVIGQDAESGEEVTAGCYGWVQAVTFSGGDHALVVLIKAEPAIIDDNNRPRIVLLKVEASRCDLRPGDRVTPETVVGQDVESGAEVKAGRHGRVESVNFVSADHALIVAIREEEA